MSFKDYTQRVNQHLDKYLSTQGSLREAMRYSVLSGGKRFFPILTYAVPKVLATA